MALTIKQLNDIIKNCLPTDNITLKAEVRQPKYSGGHLYMNLKDNDGIVNAIVWKNKINDNIRNLQDGDMITVAGKLDYYMMRGNINFIISKLININGEGELHIEYKKLYEKFKNKGYFDKKLQLPSKITNILLLTSNNGAAKEDFYHILEKYKCKLNITFIDVIVQGNECPTNICKILNSIDTTYDLIVITRGGGSFEDLFGFCKAELIETVYSRTLPILSAVGHQVDTTLLDYAADYVASTPTMAGQFIINHNQKYIDLLLNFKNKMKDNLYKKLYEISNKLTKYKQIVNNKHIFNNLKNIFKNNIIKQINQKILLLEQYKSKYELCNNIMITNIHNDTIDTTDDFNILLDNKKKFIIKWGDTIIKVKSYEVIN